MKKLSFTFSALILLLLVLTSCEAYAQSEGTSFEIPFSFVVADQHMPAGHYFVRSLYWNAVAIQGSTDKAGLITLAKPVQLPSETTPKLIFNCYGDRYFLSEARLPNMDTGRKFYVTEEELQVARTQTKAQLIEVAAK